MVFSWTNYIGSGTYPVVIGAGGAGAPGDRPGDTMDGDRQVEHCKYSIFLQHIILLVVAVEVVVVMKDPVMV